MTQTDVEVTGHGTEQYTGDYLLEVNNLKMYFPVNSRGIIPRHVADVKAVDDISFFVRKGETLGVVGESGCGKTTVGRSIMQVYKITQGEVIFEGVDLAQLSPGRMRRMRRRLQMIFQDPYSSLNPRMSAGNIIGEPLRIVHGHDEEQGASDYVERVAALLSVVGSEPVHARTGSHMSSAADSVSASASPGPWPCGPD